MPDLLTAQERGERRIGFAQKRRFCVRQKIDADGGKKGLPYLVRQVDAPFIVFGPDGKDGAPSRALQHAAQ